MSIVKSLVFWSRIRIDINNKLDYIQEEKLDLGLVKLDW